MGVVLQADLEAELGVELDACGLDHPWLHQEVASLRLESIPAAINPAFIEVAKAFKELEDDRVVPCSALKRPLPEEVGVRELGEHLQQEGCKKTEHFPLAPPALVQHFSSIMVVEIDPAAEECAHS